MKLLEEHISESKFEGKELPFSNEAEQSVLGSVLIDPPSLNLVRDRLKPEHFYVPHNRYVYDILCTMNAMNEAIDFVTVLEKMKQFSLPESKGKNAKSEPIFKGDEAKVYLTNLVKTVPSSATIATYAEIVLERFYVRSLITVSKDIIEMAQGGASDANMLLETAEQKMYQIRQGKDVTGLTKLDKVLELETLTRLLKISNPETRKEYVGIPTGFSMLDKTITGLNRSDLIIVGARPAMGKTAFALNIARNVAVQSGKVVCFFSLEMSRDQLAQRLLSSEARVESTKLRTGDLTPDEWTRIVSASENLKNAKMYIDETPGITVPEMKAKLRRLKDKPDLVIIDYLGLVQSAKRTENRVQEVSDITRNLKIMAKELMVPVIVCAQLSRGTEVKGKSHKPQLSDLRESGSIEQDADIVMFMYREIYYKNEKDDNPENQPDEHAAECIVAKNRHGGCETIPLYFDGAYTLFQTREIGNGNG